MTKVFKIVTNNAKNLAKVSHESKLLDHQAEVRFLTKKTQFNLYGL